MAQILRALADLPENLGTIPITMWRPLPVCKTSSRGSDTSAGFLEHCSHVFHRHTCRQTNVHIKYMNKTFKKNIFMKTKRSNVQKM